MGQLPEQFFAHQKGAVQFILDHRHVIIAHDVGLGKSASALISARQAGAKFTVIFCPAYLVFNWENEVKKWAPELNVRIISYSKLKGEAPKADFIILDECQYLKNHRAQRTQILHAYIRGIKPQYLVLLSGTPIKNRITEFHSPLSLVCNTDAPNGKKMNMSFHHFCNTFSNKIEKSFNGIKVWEYEGMRNLDQLREILRGKYQRVELKDAIDLPELSFKKILVTGKDEDKLSDAWKAFNDKKSADHFATVKMNNAIHKAPFTVEYAKELMESGSGPLIIFTDHVDSLKYIQENLKCPAISGSTSPENRAIYFSLFQMGKAKIIAGTIGAMSTGVTLTISHHVIFNDFPWVPSDLKQAIGRVYRISQTEKTIAHYILAGKIDEYILDTLGKKTDVIRAVEKNPD